MHVWLAWSSSCSPRLSTFESAMAAIFRILGLKVGAHLRHLNARLLRLPGAKGSLRPGSTKMRRNRLRYETLVTNETLVACRSAKRAFMFRHHPSKTWFQSHFSKKTFFEEKKTLKKRGFEKDTLKRWDFKRDFEFDFRVCSLDLYVSAPPLLHPSPILPRGFELK
jgi:hypothetical protein